MFLIYIFLNGFVDFNFILVNVIVEWMRREFNLVYCLGLILKLFI